MVSEAISERIRNFVVGRFPLARRQELRSSDDLLNSGIIDSLGILDLVVFLEQEFTISVQDEELGPENFCSIDCLTLFVEQKVKTGLCNEP